MNVPQGRIQDTNYLPAASSLPPQRIPPHPGPRGITAPCASALLMQLLYHPFPCLSPPLPPPRTPIPTPTQPNPTQPRRNPRPRWKTTRGARSAPSWTVPPRPIASGRWRGCCSASTRCSRRRRASWSWLGAASWIRWDGGRVVGRAGEWKERRRQGAAEGPGGAAEGWEEGRMRHEGLFPLRSSFL